MIAVLPNKVRKLLKIAACKTGQIPRASGRQELLTLVLKTGQIPRASGRQQYCTVELKTRQVVFYKMLNRYKMIIDCCPSERSEESVKNGCV